MYDTQFEPHITYSLSVLLKVHAARPEKWCKIKKSKSDAFLINFFWNRSEFGVESDSEVKLAEQWKKMHDELICKCWKKDMYRLLLSEESIPGVAFSIWRSRDRDLKKLKWPTLKGYNSILAEARDVLVVKFISHNVPAQLGFRFFRAHRGRLHPQF